MGIKVKLVLIGRKGIQYFNRRPQYNIASECQRAGDVYIYTGRVESNWLASCSSAQLRMQRSQQAAVSQARALPESYAAVRLAMTGSRTGRISCSRTPNGEMKRMRLEAWHEAARPASSGRALARAVQPPVRRGGGAAAVPPTSGLSTPPTRYMPHSVVGMPYSVVGMHRPRLVTGA